MKKLMLIILGIIYLTINGRPNPDGFVTVKGKEIILPDGKPILLKGINLGNWLVPEGYMF